MAKIEVELISFADKNCPNYQNPVNMTLHEDGAISFSKDAAEHFIYLYPDQVKMALQVIATNTPKLDSSVQTNGERK